MVELPDPRQIARYQQWEKQARSDLPGRYSMGLAGSPVFVIEDEDRPVVTNHMHIGETADGAVASCGERKAVLRVPDRGLNAEALRKCLDMLDGKTPFKAVCAAQSAGASREHLRQLLQVFLGQSIFLPDAVDALEQRIRRAEIVRFPMQSPYLILRSYWSNCADARSFVPEFMTHLETVAAFKSGLSSLHVITTMGCDLDTFYGGSGGVPTIPGGYRAHPMRTGLSEGKARFIDARLKALGYAGMRCDDRLIYAENGTLLGAAADRGRTFRHPPPDHGVLDRILEDMREVLVAVAAIPEGARAPEALALLSRFHKLFLHAHPFYNINNSVAMNIVDYCLERIGFGVIPHLVLDFVALRTSFDEYATVFSEAVENFAFRSRAWEEESGVLERIAAYHAGLQTAAKQAGEV